MLSGRIPVLVAAILLTMAWICYIVGNAVPSWGIVDTESIGFSGTSGLWRVCSNGICGHMGSICDGDGDSCSKLLAARAFITFACIVLPFAIGCLIFVIIKNNFNPPFLQIGKGLADVAFVFGIIGVAIGISFFIQGSLYKLGAAAIISIIGIILNLAGAVIGSLIRVKQP